MSISSETDNKENKTKGLSRHHWLQSLAAFTTLTLLRSLYFVYTCNADHVLVKSAATPYFTITTCKQVELCVCVVGEDRECSSCWWAFDTCNYSTHPWPNIHRTKHVFREQPRPNETMSPLAYGYGLSRVCIEQAPIVLPVCWLTTRGHDRGAVYTGSHWQRLVVDCGCRVTRVWALWAAIGGSWTDWQTMIAWRARDIKRLAGQAKRDPEDRTRWPPLLPSQLQKRNTSDWDSRTGNTSSPLLWVA